MVYSCVFVVGFELVLMNVVTQAAGNASEIKCLCDSHVSLLVG